MFRKSPLAVRSSRDTQYTLESLEPRAMLSSSLESDARSVWNLTDGQPIDAIIAGDFDADGDQDIAAASGRRLAFIENRGNGLFLPPRVQALANRVTELLAAPLDGRAGDDLLAVTSGVGIAQSRSLVRALYFDTTDASFRVGAATAINGKVIQSITGNVLGGARHEILLAQVDRIVPLFMPTRSRFEFLQSPAALAQDRAIVGIALRQHADTHDQPTLIIATNTHPEAAAPTDPASMYEITDLAFRLTVDVPIPVVISEPIYTYPNGFTLLSVAAGNLDADQVDEIVVSTLTSISGLNGRTARVELFNLDQPSIALGIANEPSILTSEAPQSGAALPAYFVRSIGELNADGLPDILIERRITGPEGEARVVALGLYQQNLTSFTRFQHTAELAIPATFPPGRAILGASLTRGNAGLSIIALRSLTVTTNQWSTLSVLRNTVANKRPVVQDVSFIGPTETNPSRYIIAFASEPDVLRGGSIARVEAFYDVNNNNLIDDADVLLGLFSPDTPPSYPDQTFADMPDRSDWYLDLSVVVNPPSFTFLVRAVDNTGAFSAVRSGTLLQFVP